MARRGGLADCRHPQHAVVSAAGGKLAASAPSGEGSTSYRYDPNDPYPTTGGNNCGGAPTIAGPVDQAPLDARADIVRFASDPLTAPLTIAGPVKMDLHATTDGRDTDWMIKSIDVHPDGKAYPMAEGSCGRDSGTGSTSPRRSPRDRRTGTPSTWSAPHSSSSRDTGFASTSPRATSRSSTET